MSLLDLFRKIYRFLRGLYYSACENLGISFYLKPQRYRFLYEVSLSNNSCKSKAVDLMIPIAVGASNVSFDPKPVSESKDTIYGNAYVVWRCELEAKETRKVFYEAEVTSSPKVFSENDMKWKFDDYGKMKSNQAVYLNPNGYLSCGDASIVNKAQELRGPEQNVMKVMKSVADYVLSRLKYANPIEGLYKADHAFKSRGVDCGGFSTLFASLAMALGVPSRIVSGFWAGYGRSTMHAWAEFMLPDGKWIPADLSVQQLAREGKTVKSGRFGFVGSDRIVMSYGCDIPVVVGGKEMRVDILQNPNVYADGDLSQFEVKAECTSRRL